jgi:diguanylate cyclase (GGDEF)-like protein
MAIGDRIELPTQPVVNAGAQAPGSLDQASLPLRLLHLIQAILPHGGWLPQDVWAHRHRGLLILLWLHIPPLMLLGLIRGNSLDHVLAEESIIVVLALAGGSDRLGRQVRAVAVSAGLVTCSAVLVHFSGGYVEMHFHFFVVVALIALYQDWLPFLVAIGYVALHHGVIGVLAPSAVYNHPDAIAHPWLWAGIHAGFVLAASVASMTAWRLNERQALHDPLTRLPNRVLLLDRLAHALALSARRREAVTLLFADLDGFKAVNDSLGHLAGDRLLVDVAARLGECLRSSDSLARLGGDEFAILLEDIHDADEGKRVALRVIEALQQPFTLSGRRVSIGVSIGVALGEPGRHSAAELLRNADVAMYAAKSAGKGRYALFVPAMHADAVRRMELEADLRRAIESEELEVYHQPIVDIDTGAIAGTEALVRWRHPVRGLVSPIEFIPLAEQTGLIVPLGRWVLRTACQQAIGWTRDNGAPLRLSVNLSTKQVADRAIVDDVAAALKDSGLDPARLVLEITESVLMQEGKVAVERLHALKRLGVRLALDDFGTGYSSLAYLERLPVDVLKIDKSFTDRLATEDADAPLVDAIVDLGHTLKLRIVAEGVEHREQWDRLRELGCDQAQGYYFAKPQPAAEIGPLLAWNQSSAPAGSAA